MEDKPAFIPVAEAMLTTDDCLSMAGSSFFTRITGERKLTLLTASQSSSLIVAAFLGLVAVNLGVLALFSQEYIASNGNVYLFTEIGYFLKYGWFYFEFEPFAQTGFHTNQITSQQYYNDITPIPWTYIPIVTYVTTSSISMFVNDWHTSIWPVGFP